MNNFFTDEFNISKINICMMVKEGAGQKIHKNRPYHGLVLQLSGQKQYVFENGQEIIAKKGTLFYLPKYSNYQIKTLEGGDCIAVNFELTDSRITYPAFSLSTSYFAKYEPLFTKLLDSRNLKKQGYMNVCYMTLYTILCHIQKDAFPRYTQSKDKNTAAKGAEYIAKNIGKSDLTVAATATLLDISPEYFRKIFKSVYGISPKKYMLDLRIARAKELLLSNEFGVAEISTLCGYESTAHFCSEFKRIVSRTPTEYKTNKQ